MFYQFLSKLILFIYMFSAGFSTNTNLVTAKLLSNILENKDHFNKKCNQNQNYKIRAYSGN